MTAESFHDARILKRGREIFSLHGGEFSECLRCGRTVVDVVFATVGDGEGGVLAETGETFECDAGRQVLTGIHRCKAGV